MGQGLGHGPNFVDEDQDGTCDNFVDADGDGQCDNCGGIQRGPRSGSGQGMGRGMHGGRVWNGQNQP
jgi:hypothetical protein